MVRRWVAKREEKEVSCISLFESELHGFSALGRRRRSEDAQAVLC